MAITQPAFVALPYNTKSTLNISADAVIKASRGVVAVVNVLVAGAAGEIHDCATVGAASAANRVAIIPAVVGTYVLNFPCATGIVYKVGAAQVISVSYL